MLTSIVLMVKYLKLKFNLNSFINSTFFNDARNRTEQFRSETETEAVGSVENPGFRPHIKNLDRQSTKCISTPNCSSASARGTRMRTYTYAQEARQRRNCPAP